MPSHLNRLVFRKIIANESIVCSGCLRQSPRHRNGLPHPSLLRPQRRHMLNLFNTKQPREVVAPTLDPGLEKLIEYAKMKRLDARLPPPDQIAQALTKFFAHKAESDTPLVDIQAQYALDALAYLKSQDISLLPQTFVSTAFKALRKHRHPSPVHRDLALSLYQVAGDQALDPAWPMVNLITALCRIGYPLTARDFLVGLKGEDTLDTLPDEESGRFEQRLWAKVLTALASENNLVEFNRTFALMEELGVKKASLTAVIMARYYASIDDIQNAEMWYQLCRQPGPYEVKSPDPTNSLQEYMLQMSLRTSRLDIGQSIIKDIMVNTPRKLQWDMIFEWAAGTGKGVDEIDRMMSIMERTNQSDPPKSGSTPRVPDVLTINRLVKLAISRNDPYMAERFVALGRRRGIEPNDVTLTLQMDYRLSVNDIDGALVAYKHLQALDVSSNDDLPAINRLICSMCASDRQDFDTIMNVAADLSDRRVPFEQSTVSALSVLHLSRNEIHDVLDLLNTHVGNFSASERASVRDTLVDYCLDTSTSTTRAWDTYNILKQVFEDSMPRELRTRLMDNFFGRGRADMAVHVFNHMRTHNRVESASTVETYVSCFTGIARLKDHESLEAVHNHVKLDYNIEPDTRLRNALILAYTACELPRKALKFWDDIVSSREGPTINSIHLALRACEVSPWGDEKAQEIWARLVRAGIELDQALWASYGAGLVGNGNVQDTIRTLEGAYEGGKLEMDTLVIGSVFNAAPGQSKQAEVESWAKTRFPGVWAGLEAIGMRTSDIGMRYFKIDRHVDP